MRYIKDKNNKTHTVELYGTENKTATLCIDNRIVVNLKMYYRPEKTWNDHLGNTPCGYYVNLPLSKTERKRFYIYS